MSDGEVTVLVAATVIAVVLWGRWYAQLFRTFSPDCPTYWRLVLALALPVALVGTVAGLHLTAASVVRDDGGYLLLFAAVMAASLAATNTVLALAGIDVVRDLVERRNPTVIAAAGGVFAGDVLLNIGANIGEGATIDTTLDPLLMTWMLYMLLIVLALRSGPAAVHIANEHSWVASIRLGGVALAAAIPLAKAAGGDWAGLGYAMGDIAKAFPLALLPVAAAWGAARAWPITARNSFAVVLVGGGVVAAAYLGLAIALTRWLI